MHCSIVHAINIYITCDVPLLVSYPDPNVRNDDYRLCTLYYTVSDNAYVRLGLGTRLSHSRLLRNYVMFTSDGYVDNNRCRRTRVAEGVGVKSGHHD